MCIEAYVILTDDLDPFFSEDGDQITTIFNE